MESILTYKDRDNSFTVTLKKNGIVLTEQEMQSITKFELKFNDSYYNSQDNGSGFERNDASGTVKIKPEALDLPAIKDKSAELLVYDNGEYQNGLVWDSFIWVVSGDVVPPS